MSFDWKKTLAAVAPTLATALGGPLAGVATQMLGKALLGDEQADEAAIAAAITTGGTDALAKLKEVDNAFKIRMKELDIDIERVHAGDRDSARKREASTGDSWTPRILAVGVTLGFFGVLFYLLNWGKPESGGDALLVMLGSLGAGFAAVLNYYFGSSSGSDKKTSLLDRKG